MSAVSDRTAWMDEALCAKEDPDLWFDGRSHKDADRICAACPVKAQCQAAGANEYRGIWGGVQITRKTVGLSPSIEYLGFPHGTEGGYSRHLREGTPPCGRCSVAHQYDNRESAARNPRTRTEDELAQQKLRRKERRQALRQRRAIPGVAFTGIRDTAAVERLIGRDGRTEAGIA